jgi:hypothetical protein
MNSNQSLSLRDFYIQKYNSILNSIKLSNSNKLTKDQYITLKVITYSITNFIMDNHICNLMKEYELQHIKEISSL